MKNAFTYAIATLLLIVLILIALRCNTDNCLHDTGTLTNLHIETGYFKSIYINGIFNINMVQDTTYYVDLEGGSEVLKYTQIQNADSNLFMNNTNSCNFLHDYERVTVNIHFRDIEKMSVDETCDIKSINALTDNFSIAVGSAVAEINLELNNQNFFFYTNKHTGGLFKFTGHCQNCTLWGFYTSKIDASDLKTEIFHVYNGSIGDFRVNAEEKLYSIIGSQGNVYYSGSATVMSDSLSGSGRLIKIEGKK